MADPDMWQISGLTPSTDPEIRQLQEFVWELRELLEDVVNNPRPAIPGRHHKRFKAAWEDVAFPVEPDGGFYGHGFLWLVKNLDGIETPGESQQPVRQKLSDVGLIGVPLDFKLGVYHHARDEYLDYGTVAQMQSEPKSRWPGMRKLFGRVLQTAGVILGSTASQIPGGEYIKEFVEDVHLLTEISGDMEELSSTK